VEKVQFLSVLLPILPQIQTAGTVCPRSVEFQNIIPAWPGKPQEKLFLNSLFAIIYEKQFDRQM